jgi:5'(3')-deoxyribonucleotidase
MSIRPLHILKDADGTLLDWGGHWDWMRLSERFANYTNIPLTKDQRSFNLKLGLNEEESAAVDEMFDAFKYGKLKPIEGAVEAYRKAEEAGHFVQIATSPWWTNRKCLQGKSNSILKYFGEDARKNMILTGDKTVLRGDYLFDDKPEIRGHYSPMWQQILFDQPYNQEIDLPRITSWDQEEDTLQFLEELNVAVWDAMAL